MRRSIGGYQASVAGRTQHDEAPRAPLVERGSDKAEVPGSNPGGSILFSSSFFPPLISYTWVACVLHIKAFSFHPSTSSTTRVRADSTYYSRYTTSGLKTYDTDTTS